MRREEDAIETLLYQARNAIEHRPCGMAPCREDFPGQPSRWCSGCVIEALLETDATRANHKTFPDPS